MELKDLKLDDCQLMFGDCLERMKGIGDKSIDMILCDLPYGQLNKKNPNAKWDCKINLNFLWAEYDRIIKDNGAIVLFANGMFTAELMYSNCKMWKYNLIWDKVAKTGFLNSKKMPLRQHEDICVFYKKLPMYNPQMEKASLHKRNHSKGDLKNPTKNQCYGSFVETPTIITDEKYPTSIIRISKEHSNGHFFHPTQKPVALLEYLIKTYTNEGEIVLDNTFGSCSTGVAAVNTNRNFIGIELDEKYYDISCKRIKEAINEKKQQLF